MIYDLYQLPDQARIDLKNSLLQLIVSNKEGAKLINIQLALALANLALQLLSWTNAVQDLVSLLGKSPDTIPALLEFLKVLPEELSHNRRIPMTDQEFRVRTTELLTNNAEDVMRLLLSYLESTQDEAVKTLIFQCFGSWLREINPRQIINSPFLDLIFQALNDQSTFEPAVDCICSMIRETREVDDSMDMIQALYPKVIALRSLIVQSKDDLDTFEGLTAIFAEAGDSWHPLAARAPKDFRPLVEAIAECAAYDEDLDVVKYTFNFWYMLQQMIVTDRFSEARNEFGDIYLKLIDILMDRLQYPSSSNNADPFNGNREAEDKFKSFRHEMGDVLKDCCSVVGSSKALSRPFERIRTCLQGKAEGKAYSWQAIEAGLFAIRCMGSQVQPSESEIMPQFMNLLTQLPNDVKVRYTTTLILGRYTEWSNSHPEFLEVQLNYITAGFTDNQSLDVMTAAAQALADFCYDCGSLLVEFADQIFSFYEQVSPKLSPNSYFTLTRGIAFLISAQPIASVGVSLGRFGGPICQQLLELAKLPSDLGTQKLIASKIEVLVIFVREVEVKVPPRVEDPLAKFVLEVLPVLNTVLQAHGEATPVYEKYCKFLRSSIFSCRSHLLSILPTIAETVVTQFQQHHFGSYLWVSGAIIRTYSSEDLGEQVVNSVWEFTVTQIKNFLAYISTIKDIRQVGDLIEDFFLMMGDAVLEYPFRFIANQELFTAVYTFAVYSLDLYETDPVNAVLRFLTDLFGYGMPYPPTSAFKTVPDNVRQAIIQLAREKGFELCCKLIIGQIDSLPRDSHYDASMLLVDLLTLVDAAQGSSWIADTLNTLPADSVSVEEKNKLIQPVSVALSSGDMKKVKYLIGDFITLYRRRNTAPRNVLR